MELEAVTPQSGRKAKKSEPRGVRKGEWLGMGKMMEEFAQFVWDSMG